MTKKMEVGKEAQRGTYERRCEGGRRSKKDNGDGKSDFESCADILT
jgi:hypothetical protein